MKKDKNDNVVTKVKEKDKFDPFAYEHLFYEYELEITDVEINQILFLVQNVDKKDQKTTYQYLNVLNFPVVKNLKNQIISILDKHKLYLADNWAQLYNKSNSDNPSGNIEQLGYDVNQDGEIDDVEAKLTPPRVAGDKNWDEGEPINSAQLEFILSNQVKVEIKEDDLEKPLVVNGQIVGYEQKPTGRFELVNLMENEESTAYITKVLDQAVTQNIGGIDKDIANEVLTELRNGNPQKAKELIFEPPLPTSD